MLRVVLACVAIIICELCRGPRGWNCGTGFRLGTINLEGILGWKPLMLPNQNEIFINEGEPLELTCISIKNVTFIYPETTTEGITTSPVEIKTIELGDEYKHVFLRPETIYGDAGWYGCANNDVEVQVDSTNHDDPDVSWMYVYVKSNISFFVEEDTYRTLIGVSGATAVIPCRPTSPDLPVILKGNDMSEVELGEKVSYDPKIGFTLKDITLKDSGYFTCSIKLGDMDYEVGYHLHVMRKQKLNKPKILEDTLRHVTRGQNLYVNCTIDVDTDLPYVFNWSTPQNVLNVQLSSRISTRHYRKMIGLNSQRITSELIINNVTDNDEGDYECIIKTFYDSKKDKKHITIHDPNIKYINLTSQDTNRHYQGKYGDRVQYVVYVDAYPQPKLRWFNPKGEEVMETWAEPERTKNAVQITPTSTVLRINRLDVNDMGIYVLQATNEDRIETMNFTLDVLAKPIPILEKVEPYYAPKQIAEIFCHVAASPMPNITWNFLKCPNYPSYEDSSIEYLTNASVTSKLTSFTSRVLMTVEMSGHIACTACNELGCDSTNETILVSDGNGGFGIIEPTEEVTAGDNLVVTCAASVYNYSDVIEWVDEQDEPISKSERLKITRERTPFTYRSSLLIENVQKSDMKYYVCRSRTVDGSIERIDYELQVHDAEAPYFTSTNMNQSETTFDLGTEAHKTVILTCFARGMPKPRVTWYKDDVEIENNEQYLFLHDNQELNIKYLLERDDGKYSCRAENRIDKMETYQQIAIKGKQNPKILIISIVVVVIICCILIAYFSIKAHREKVMRKELMEAGLMHFEEGAVECLNPDLTVDEQAELLPYDKKWEFPRERLKLGKQLGSGAFGVVMKAEAQSICEEEEVTTVAVKMVRRNAEPAYIRALASELKIMVHLGKHLNVVNLLGACTKNICKRELLVIVEYCRFGNLHNYLLRHRASFINQIDPSTGKIDPAIGIDLLTRTTSVGSNNSRIKYAALSFSRSLSANSAGSNNGTEPMDYRQTTDSQSVSMSPDGCVLSNNSTQPGWRSNYRGDYKDHNLKPICTQDLLSWAFQVARGMEYLSYRKVLHGDLAARNILLADNNVVKICDFGLAKTMYKDDNYEKKGDGPLPIKWMAIESIRDRVFSTQSDVWSFGIVLWEFFTLAETPYPGMQARQQYQKLIEGYRMEQPEYCVREVYDIMLQCWKAKPSLRPMFTELVESIGDLLEQSVRMHYVDLNAPYIDMNTSTLEDGKSDYLTMMSAPDHAALSSPICDYVNSPGLSAEGIPSDPDYLCMSPNGQVEESGIFSPRPLSQNSHFEFPSPAEKTSVYSDSEDAVELAPMLDNEDNYLKPIDVQQRRAEFARQRQTQNKIDRPMERDSGYCNTLRNLHLIDLNEVNVGENDETDSSPVDEKNDKLSRNNSKGFVPNIIRTQDNYVNMPKQKSDLRKEPTDSFSNPSYVMMSNRELNQTRV